jgi:DegV family protein with EDD domain
MSTIPEPDGQEARTGVAVVTDSTTYLPRALLQRRQIAQVSLYVGWDGERLPEGEYELDDFYSRLRSSPSLPSTSQPSVGDFLAVYEPLAAAGRDVVSIHIAAGLSGTCESAREAARTIAGRGLPGRVEVIDGETGAGGLGCLVLAAAEAAERGLDIDQIVAAVAETRAGLEIWFCLDTLEYLRKGGRIGAAQALLGSALKIKPILTFGTEIAPVGRVRTARRAHERMVAYLRELRDRGASGWIVQHAQLPEEAASLVAAGEEILSSGVLVGGIGLAPATAE